VPDAVTFERKALPDSTDARLRTMGYTIKFGGVQGDGHSIMMGDGVAYGAADPHGPDSKASVP
jgi:hypothetical protein